ncbi:MAG: Gfo/Idh/MocA family oxidoreductase, partial [Spirochaetales bacterium]
MTTINLGLIGCGGRLRDVVKRVSAAADASGVRVRVVALTDPSAHSLAQAHSELPVDESARVFDDYHDLVALPQVDWVMVGSWNCFHAEHVIAAFAAGKHVFCEKPLALTEGECLAMREAWKRSGTQFTIGFTLRYSPHYVKIKETLSGNTIGRVISMEFNETLDFNHGGFIHADWRRKTEWAGSHLLEKCCHDVDLVNWMLESVPVKTASFGGCDYFRSENAG